MAFLPAGYGMRTKQLLAWRRSVMVDPSAVREQRNVPGSDGGSVGKVDRVDQAVRLIRPCADVRQELLSNARSALDRERRGGGTASDLPGSVDYFIVE
jgi:hypothetical protein